MSNQNVFRVGLFGIGLDAYWSQFPGLEERLSGYLQKVRGKMEEFGAEVVSAGLVDSTDKAFEAGHFFRKEDVDVLFIHVTTYALSSTVLPVVSRAGVPVVVLNISPQGSLDYKIINAMEDRTAMTGEWLAHCSACPVPEISNVFQRVGIPFAQVTGILEGDDFMWNELREWVDAARVRNILAHNRMGCMGHYYSGMLDIYTDLTLLVSVFGGHMEMIEVDELTEIRKRVGNIAIAKRVEQFYGDFDVQPDCSKEELERAARTSVALDSLVEKYKLGSLAYYYKGEGENLDTMSSVILGNSLLTARGIPVAGEYEVKNALAMKIMDAFGAGGSFTEYYAMDYEDDIVLMGHDGPGHIKIGEGKTRVRPLEVYHGKVGKGLSVEMSVKTGPVTLLSVVQKPQGETILLVAEGKTVGGPILEIGNTNSRYRFSIGARGFVERWNAEGPAHHCAVGTGHHGSKIRKLAKLLNIKCVQVV